MQLFWIEVVILVCIRNDEIEQEFGGGGGAGVFETVVQAILGWLKTASFKGKQYCVVFGVSHDCLNSLL